MNIIKPQLSFKHTTFTYLSDLAFKLIMRLSFAASALVVATALAKPVDKHIDSRAPEEESAPTATLPARMESKRLFLTRYILSSGLTLPYN